MPYAPADDVYYIGCKRTHWNNVSIWKQEHTIAPCVGVLQCHSSYRLHAVVEEDVDPDQNFSQMPMCSSSLHAASQFRPAQWLHAQPAYDLAEKCARSRHDPFQILQYLQARNLRQIGGPAGHKGTTDLGKHVRVVLSEIGTDATICACVG